MISRPRRGCRDGRAARPRRDGLTGCPWHDVKAMLRQVGLRPTRQRMALGWILFAKGDRHLTAEMLYEEATKRQGAGVARDRLQHAAPVHRSRPAAPGRGRRLEDLFRHQRLRRIITSSSRARTSCVDIPGAEVIVGKMPAPPEGYEIARVDVVVRLRQEELRSIATARSCIRISCGRRDDGLDRALRRARCVTLTPPSRSDRRPTGAPARSSRRSRRR